jgi:hypothetical protein
MAKNYKCEDEMHLRCSNNALCHLCDGVALFKDPVAERNEKFRIREENKEAEKTAIVKSHKKEKKEGMAFEKRVASQWNNKFGGNKKKKVAKPRLDMLLGDADTSQEKTDTRFTPLYQASALKPIQRKSSVPKVEAVRQPNSGAMWNNKGDIKLEHALMECKERGSTNSRGEKTISIPKLWIEKQEKEAFQEQRPYWYIPFGYKGDDGIYLVKSYNHEMEMIYEMRKQREEIERLHKELEAIKNENS